LTLKPIRACEPINECLEVRGFDILLHSKVTHNEYHRHIELLEEFVLFYKCLWQIIQCTHNMFSPVLRIISTHVLTVLRNFACWDLSSDFNNSYKQKLWDIHPFPYTLVTLKG